MSNVDEILASQSYPLELLTTKLGAMKSTYQGNIFEFHFNRNGVKFWRCNHFRDGCKAKIISHAYEMWPLTTTHNHNQDPVEFVPTHELVKGGEAVAREPDQPVKAEQDATRTETTTSATTTNVDLKLRLKERFAAIGRKIQKN